MHIKTISFTLGKTTPLEPITHNEDDRYANVKPSANVEIELDDGDDVGLAFEHARNVCFTQLVEFHMMLVEALKQ